METVNTMYGSLNLTVLAQWFGTKLTVELAMTTSLHIQDLFKLQMVDIAMSAATTSYGAGARDFWVIKTDSYGNVQYTKTYGGMGAETPYSIAQAADGSLVIAGFTNSFGAGGYDIYIS